MTENVVCVQRPLLSKLRLSYRFVARFVHTRRQRVVGLHLRHCLHYPGGRYFFVFAGDMYIIWGGGDETRWLLQAVCI